MKIRIVLMAALILSFIGTTFLLSCGRKEGHRHPEASEESKILYYTCPMHPQIRQDKPGECPICHMTLVPVYQEETTAPKKDEGSGPSVGISSERQQLIGVKTIVATKRPATKEIRTVGRVAFDPELAVAEREFIEIVRNVPSLKAAATARLRLSGVSEEEIKALEKMARKGTGTSSYNLFLPKEGESVWVYATLYQDEMDLVPVGSDAVVTLPSDAGKTFSGKVRAVTPTIDPMTRSARARIEVPGAGGHLRPESYVDVSLKIDLGEALLIPKSAVLETGRRRIAFVVHEGNHFQARELKVGAAAGEDIVVLHGIEEGEVVVSSATFLIDSESRLKAAISGMEGHQH